MVVLKIWGPKHENSGPDFEKLSTWRRITSEWNKISSVGKVRWKLHEEDTRSNARFITCDSKRVSGFFSDWRLTTLCSFLELFAKKIVKLRNLNRFLGSKVLAGVPVKFQPISWHLRRTRCAKFCVDPTYPWDICFALIFFANFRFLSRTVLKKGVPQIRVGW